MSWQIDKLPVKVSAVRPYHGANINGPREIEKSTRDLSSLRFGELNEQGEYSFLQFYELVNQAFFLVNVGQFVGGSFFGYDQLFSDLVAFALKLDHLF